MDPRSWAVFKSQAGRVPVPRLSPGEAEALHRAEWARRQAEQEYQRVQLGADLAQEKARVDAGIDPVQPPSETSVESFIDQHF